MNKKLVMLGALLAIPIVYAQRFSFPSTYGFGGYGGGFFDLGGIYSQYPGFVDFLAFFMIFSGISRLVFSRLFPSDKVGVKTLYVGLGFALAFGGTYYGYLSLANFGNFAFAFAIIIGMVALYGLFTMLGMNRWLAIFLAIAVTLFAAPIFAGVNENAFGTDIFSAIPSALIFTVAGAGIVLGLIWLLFYMIKNRKKGRRSASSQGLPNTPSSGWFKRWKKGNKPGSINQPKRGMTKALLTHFDNAYTSFEEGQFNRMADLGTAIQNWLKEYTAENQGAKGYDEFSGQRNSDSRRKEVVSVLRQLRSNTRYQARRLRWTRKQIDQLGDKEMGSLINKLEVDESDFRLYLSKLYDDVAKPAFANPQEVSGYYTRLRNITLEMIDVYSKLKNRIRG